MKTLLNLLRLITWIFVLIFLTNLWLLAFEDSDTLAFKKAFFTLFLMWAVIAMLFIEVINQWFEKKCMEREYNLLHRHYQAEVARQHLTGFIQKLVLDDEIDDVMGDIHDFIEKSEETTPTKKEKKDEKK